SGIRKQEVGRSVRLGLPKIEIRFHPADGARRPGGDGQHLGRMVHAHDPSVGPSGSQETRHVPRAAAQVVDRARRLARNALGELDCRAEAMIAVEAVLLRIPARGGTGPPLDFAHAPPMPARTFSGLSSASPASADFRTPPTVSGVLVFVFRPGPA